MTIVSPSEGQIELTDKMIKDALNTDESYTLKLYKNNYTPVEGSTGSDFTEADFTGYSAKTLTRAGWSGASYGSGHTTITYGSTQTWTCSGTGNTIYGMYIVATTSGKVLWAELFSSTKVLADTDTLTYTPSITFDNA